MASTRITSLMVMLGLALSGCGDDNGDPVETDGTTFETSTTSPTGSGSTSGDTTSPTTTAMTSTSAGPTTTEGETEDDGDAETAGTGGTEGEDTDVTPGDSDTEADTDETPTGEGLEELVALLCEWEFTCCAEGEINYRLGPFVTDAEDCTARYIEQLYSNDNAPENSVQGGLLSTLAFGLRLDRSVANPEAVEACIDATREQGCNRPAEGDFCVPTEGESPCDLRRMFSGQQQIGERCSEAWAHLDIECEVGSSCEQVDGDYICVDKSRDDEFCEGDATCDQGFFCSLSNGRCAPKSDVGERCTFEDGDEPVAGTETLPCLEGLTCTPDAGSDVDGTCAQACTEGYQCSSDSQCPESLSCVPVEIGTGLYNYCLPRGSASMDRCDTQHDCVESSHCNAGRCRGDLGVAAECLSHTDCETGLYCDNVEAACAQEVDNGDACTDDAQCGPTALGCITGNDAERLCRTQLLSNGTQCVPGETASRLQTNWCASGICEVSGGDEIAECVPGLDEGDDCATSDLSVEDLDLCAPGLYCDEDSVCRVKQDAGGSCETDGALECLNSSCVSVWEGDYCSDAPASQDVATCDGDD